MKKKKKKRLDKEALCERLIRQIVYMIKITNSNILPAKAIPDLWPKRISILAAYIARLHSMFCSGWLLL